MNIFKKIKLKVSSYRRLKAYQSNIKRLAEIELLNNSKRQKEVALRSQCLIYGHKWKNEPNNNELNIPITKRTYCERCGKYYSQEIYKQL